MRKCFCCPPVEISKGKNRTKVVAGGQECRKHNRQPSLGGLKEEPACSRCLATEEVKAATMVAVLSPVPSSVFVPPVRLRSTSELNGSRFPLKFTIFDSSTAVSAPSCWPACQRFPFGGLNSVAEANTIRFKHNRQLSFSGMTLKTDATNAVAGQSSNVLITANQEAQKEAVQPIGLSLSPSPAETVSSSLSLSVNGRQRRGRGRRTERVSRKASGEEV